MLNNTQYLDLRGKFPRNLNVTGRGLIFVRLQNKILPPLVRNGAQLSLVEPSYGGSLTSRRHHPDADEEGIPDENGLTNRNSKTN